MTTRIINLWDAFRTGFWFVPSIMGVAAIALATILPRIDAAVDEELAAGLPWLTTTGPTARLLLSTITGVMFTVLGIVFSSTVVTLSITASQFGSRLLRTFMRDFVTHVTLGICVATGVYCLLALRAVRQIEDGWFVPSFTVFAGTILAILSFGALIRFIDHVATSIQAFNVVAAVAMDLDDSIERLFPERIGDAEDETDIEQEGMDGPMSVTSVAVEATCEGYLQAINGEGLLNLAVRHEALVRLECQPGDFITRGIRVASVVVEQPLEGALADEINLCLLVGNRRTPRQDVSCALHELVEVAVRALSPGINDPITAIACVDRLAASLSRLAERRTPSPYRYDEHGTLRVVARPKTFRHALDEAFDPIRQYGKTSVGVTISLLRALRMIGGRLRRENDAAALLRQAEMILRGSEQGIEEENDRSSIRKEFDAVRRQLAVTADGGDD